MGGTHALASEAHGLQPLPMRACLIASLLSFIALGSLSCASCSENPQAPKPSSDASIEEGAGTQGLALSLVAEGFEQITDVEFLRGPGRRAVVLNKEGRAQLVDLAGASAEKPARPSHTVFELEVDTPSELGLLALAFHPDYAENGRLFVHYNPKGKQATRLSEFQLPMAELSSGTAKETRVLFEFAQPYTNHNGGELVFGPDGKLYWGVGDGGSAGDPQNRAQDLGLLFGKVLRLDVDADDYVPQDNPFVNRSGARPEIFAYGLRNPWKLSFTPDERLVVADVGQDKFEEIDLVRAGDNMGWRRMEGSRCFKPTTGCRQEGMVDPVFEYGRELGGSVTGGYVYTGKLLPQLRGKYVFADFLSGRMWALTLPTQEGDKADAEELAALSVLDVKTAAFGRDADGELYVSDFGAGKLYQLTAARP